MECVGSWIAGKIADYAVEPVRHQLGYIFHYKRNVGNLIAATQDLNLENKRMEDLVVEAKRRGEEIYDDVKDCQTKVDSVTKDAEKLLNSTGIKCSFMGSFSYLVSWYQLSKKAKEMGDSVVEIKGKIRFDNISFRPKLQSNFENKDYLSFATREKFEDEIMEALGDRNIRMIGVHGMPGAGKTTLVKEIARKALAKDRRLFDDAVIVTVSQTPNLEKIQQQIAERLDLELRKKTISERALELKNRLKGEKKLLIVIDDVWKKLDLVDVGIDFESDQKGCKILITSRFERVLGTEMGVDKNFKVELLSEEEATKWFNDRVGDSVKTRGFKEYGSKIVKKCGCLPIVIVTVANSLRNCDELPLWRDTWRQLQRSKHNETVQSAIKLCYDKLENEAKLLFLLCALYDEDANIQMEYLMRYGVGQMDIFKDVYTLQDARDRVYRLVRELKDRCLLIDGDHPGAVKMHDVILDVAKSIAKESHNMHCFRDADEVAEYLKEKKFEDLKAISLRYGYLDELTCERSEYTQLQLIILEQGKLSLQTFPNHFFEKTKQLRVLDMMGPGSNFLGYPRVLSSSLCELQNLRTLCLCYFKLRDIAIIGELKKLEILDLSNSHIYELPSQIGELTHLRMLDLSGCLLLQQIEPNVILRLKRLEELYMGCFKNWHRVQDVGEERRSVGLDELKHLVRLTALNLQVPDIKMLPEDFLSQKWERYKISIGVNENDHYVRYEFSKSSGSRYLQINHTECNLLHKYGFEMLLKGSEQLWLDGLNGVNNIVYELDAEGFPELKHFRLQNNDKIEYLVSMMGQIQPCSAFGSLETLWLDNLRNLKEICHGELAVDSFKTLRIVRLVNCMRLKNLFPFSTARQLEKIEVTGCEEMEEIFTHVIEEDDDDDNEAIDEFPLLCSLRLMNVSKLRQFCSKLKKIHMSPNEEKPFDANSIMPLFNGKFSFPKLENLEVCGCDFKKIWDDQLLVPSSASFRCLTTLVIVKCQFLKYVFSSATASSFEQLYSLEVKDCSIMEEIMSRDEKMGEISFPRLYYLYLENLPNLATFSSEIFIQFPMLIDLFIKDCPEMETFVSNSLVAKSCTTMPSLFNRKVAFPSLNNVKIVSMDRLKMIWQYELFSNADSFCKLEDIKVQNCKNLMKIFPSGMHTRLCNLKSLKIRDCEMVEEIFEIQPSNSVDRVATQLNSLKLHGLSNLKYVWSEDPQGTFTFPNLKEVEAFQCPNMKAIFPPSVAKGLLQLNLIYIEKCGIEEIVSKEEAGLETVSPDEFVFPMLNEMKLRSLPNLVSFKEGPHTSRFPLLKWLEVEDCMKVKVLLGSDFLSFQQVHGSADHDIPIQQPLFFMDYKFVSFPKLKKLEIVNCGTMEEIMSRDERIDKISFPKLDYLDLENLPNLLTFSSEIFIEFPMLTRLYIEDCPEFKSFVSNSSEGKSCTTMPSLFNENVAFPSLKILHIQGMNRLKMIWHYKLCSNNADSFCKLEKVEVENCKNLMKIFPCGMDSRLGNLTGLKVSDCERVEEIFEIQTSNSEEIGDTMSTQLTSILLHGLSNLKYVWSKDPQGTFTFPNLERVDASDCPNLKAVFPPSMAKGLSQLEGLYIKNCGIEEIVGKEEGVETAPPEFVFPQLQKMQLKSLPNLVSFYARPHTSRFPLLEWLQVKQCMKVKVFFSTNFLSFQGMHGSLFVMKKVTFDSGQCQDLDGEDDQECAGALPHLSRLKLRGLPNLMDLMEESSQQQQPAVFHDLTDLEVLRCGRLKILVPSSISFQNLTDLRVSHCHGMLHLLSSQTAKTMTKLREMKVSECKRMAEIIADSSSRAGNTEGGEIVFSGLKTLELDSLPSLTNFYSGNHAMGFPALESLVVSGCFELQSFSKHSTISTPKMNELFIEGENYCEMDDISNTMDLNTIVPSLWKIHPGTTLQQLFT